MVRCEISIFRLDSDNAVIRHGNLLRRGAEMNAATSRFNGSNQFVDQCLRTTFQIAEFLLHNAFPRRSDPLDPGPDPGCRDRVGIFIEFVSEKSLPKTSVSVLTAPLGYPFFR